MQKNHKLTFQVVLYVIAACMVIFLQGCDYKKNTAESKKRSPRPLPVVGMAEVNYQLLHRRINLTGTLEPKKLVRIYNQTPGLIIKLPFYEGDKIRQGDILAHLTRRRPTTDKANWIMADWIPCQKKI